MPRASIEITALDPGEIRPAADVLAAAFFDDPTWRGIGPRWSERHRRLANRVAFWGLLNGARRHQGCVRLARRGGEVAGVSISFDPGAWPIPETAAAWELPWVLAAGPLPVWRGFGDDRVQRSHQDPSPHVYLWFLGVDPAHQRTGVGRALMGDLHERSDRLGMPTRLETGTEANLAFYGSLGYETGEWYEMPRSGAGLWKMERAAAERIARGGAGDRAS